MKKLISIIVPVYNEEKNLNLLHSSLMAVWKNLEESYNYEVIFINDGSADESGKIIRQMAFGNPQIKCLEFSRNFGHQNAIEAGLKHAAGDTVIMMDADLQHPPELIDKMVSKWQEGYQIVNTVRKNTEKEGLIKKITSKGFYWLFNKISAIKLQKGVADFRLLDREVVNVLNNLSEKQKFYRGLVNWTGYKSISIPYDAKQRLNGQSHYTFDKMASLARTGLTSFSMLPMKIILFVGLLVSSLSFLLLLLMLYFRFFISANYFSSLSFIVVFILLNNGILLIFQGIIALYLVNIHDEMQNRPSYIIRRKINFEDNKTLNSLSIPFVKNKE